MESRSKSRVPRNRVLLRVERRARNEIALEVVELELGGLADQVGGALLVVDARELDDDLVAPLLADLGLGDAGRVDAVVDDRDRVVQAFLVDLLAFLGDGLLDDFQAALEVEAERRLPWIGEPGIASRPTPIKAARIRPIRKR